MGNQSRTSFIGTNKDDSKEFVTIKKTGRITEKK